MNALTPDTVKYLVVHCSATPPDMDIGVKEIDKWHRRKGWWQIGYHAVIRRDGTIEYGRSMRRPGAHAYGFNDCSVGICLVGGVDGEQKPEDNFTPEQKESLRFVLDSLSDEFPDSEVLGHRDLPGVTKACPSFPAAEWYYGDHY